VSATFKTRLLAAALRPLGRLIVAERFAAPAGLAAIAIPPPKLPTSGPIRVILLHPRSGRLHAALLDSPLPADLALRFPPFANPDQEEFVLLLFQPPKPAPMRAWQKRLAAAATAGRRPIALPCNEDVPDPAIRGAATASWREGGSCYAEGWLETPGRSITSIGAGTAVARLKPASDDRVQFSVFVPSHTGTVLPLRVQTSAGEKLLSLKLPHAPLPPAGSLDAEHAAMAEALFRFLREADEKPGDVLHIGSRLVGSLTEDWRARFSKARRYVGMDVHPGPAVDVVGDAHELSRLFGPASFDVIFSGAVLEHLAMPWIVAAEINRVLRPGGLTYHITHQAWPLHETPNDFWRFSDEALRLLFGEPFGFEVLTAGMADRVRMYPLDKERGDLGLPLGFGFGSAWILSRKVREIDPAANPTLAGLGRRYPA